MVKDAFSHPNTKIFSDDLVTYADIRTHFQYCLYTFWSQNQWFAKLEKHGNEFTFQSEIKGMADEFLVKKNRCGLFSFFIWSAQHERTLSSIRKTYLAIIWGFSSCPCKNDAETQWVPLQQSKHGLKRPLFDLLELLQTAIGATPTKSISSIWLITVSNSLNFLFTSSGKKHRKRPAKICWRKIMWNQFRWSDLDGWKSLVRSWRVF